MTRIAVILCAFLVACDVGDATLNHDGPDGGGQVGDSGGGGGDGGGSNCVNANPTPADAHVHAAGGTSNAGLNCMADGCHGGANPTGGAFTFAGTLYTSATGGTAVAGAAIVVMVNGSPVKAYTDKGGNFYSTTTLTFPATTYASECPKQNAMMATPLNTGNGACNTCHNATAPTNGAAGVVYLQ